MVFKYKCGLATNISTMTVKEAVQRTKAHANDFFGEESVSHFQLEEVTYDDSSDVWEITLGYYVNDPRPMSGFAEVMEQLHGDKRYERKYKIFRIRDSDGAFLSMKIRETRQ